MKWDVTGIDPRKRKEKKGRILMDTIEATNMAGAVAVFCKKFPNCVQLMVVEERV